MTGLDPRLSPQKQKKILGVVGPKGGVGKSTISANLAIALTELGAKVITVDLDLGAANLHAIFGLRDFRYTLDDFLLNKVKQLTNVVLDTDISDLKIICGGDIPGIANLPYPKKVKLIRHLSKLDSDFVLLDLGAGASYNVVDFLIIAQRTLLVTTPDVPSLMNVYSFIKTAAYRRLAIYFRQKKCAELLDLLEKAKDVDNNPHLKTMEHFFRQASDINPIMAGHARKVMSAFEPFIVVNRIQTAADANAGDVIRKLMEQYLNIQSSVIMIIREDRAIKNAAAKMRPIMIESPGSFFSTDIRQIALTLCE